MAAENALVFLRGLSQARPSPSATLIAGPQAFLREYVLDRLRIKLGAEGFQYRALQVGAGDSFGALIGELEGADLFAPKRLVVGRILRSYRDRAGNEDPDSDKRPSGTDSSDEAALIAAVERIGAGIRVALVYERDTAPAKVRRTLENVGTLVNCMRPFDNQLAQYAEIFARNLGLKLSMQEADSLVARHGGDLGAINNVLSKAVIHQGEEGRSRVPSLDEPTAGRIPDLFELAESLARGSAGETLALFDRAIQIGRDPIELLALEVIPQVRRMLVAASLLARKKTAANIAAALALAPTSPLAARAIEGARRFGLDRLERAHRRACQLDASFKMGLTRERGQAVAALILELDATP
ncbi:MAG TPA: hypothetical protein VJN94_15365 [Candidatus Binataceae bacterium]|nr:hypothetical protein [Candidatus Binataceae bacterium]